MPCLIFQKEKPSGSSSTRSAASCGGRGYRPLATGEADGSPFAVPWQIARKLVADLFSEGIEAIVPTTVRETVDAVAALNKDEVSLGELATKLGLDKSVASRRLRQATEWAIWSIGKLAVVAPPESCWAIPCRTRCRYYLTRPN